MTEATKTTTSALEKTVRDRYSHGAVTVERGLCCPAGYDPSLVQSIPQ